MKKSTKLSAFTLIELLIVIAIIGILAGLMSGAIAGVMTGANATKVGNNGRNIINALIQANQDREAAARSDLWARTASSQYTTAAGGAIQADAANSYFKFLMDNEYLSGISLPDFAGAGVPAVQKVEDLDNGGNLWCTISGASNASSYTPVLWTRNFDATAATIKVFESAEDEPKLLAGNLVQECKPFGGDLIVLVRKGGAMQVIKAKQFYDDTFLGGATNKTGAIGVLLAKGTATGETTEEDQ